jgi:L,D-transpeptidase-like protein
MRLNTRVGTFVRVSLVGIAVSVGVPVSLHSSPARPERSTVSSPVAARTAVSAASASSSAFDAASWRDVGDIDNDIFALALQAASAAVIRGDAARPETLTVIDFSKPSTVKRMWVYDLRSRELLFEELVSHGRGSGRTMATAFSNEPESNQSSLGLFRTAEAYVGKNGYSLRLDGLEPGINDRARERAIVIHGAPYVSAAVAKAQGYLGRSLGCPAVRPEVNRELIDTVKRGGLVFAYYPDAQWLKTSRYLSAA